MPEYYELEVSLCHVEPRIWRRFLISKKASFQKLHEAIQEACGWEDDHLFAFREWGRRGNDIAGPSDEGFGPAWDEPAPDARKVKLADFFEGAGARKCAYVYDFGDEWEHEIRLRKVVSCPESFKRRLLDGERAFPPEDCGGIWGYAECVEIAEGRKKDAELGEWLGNWQPEAFDLEATKKAFDR